MKPGIRGGGRRVGVNECIEKEGKRTLFFSKSKVIFPYRISTTLEITLAPNVTLPSWYFFCCNGCWWWRLESLFDEERERKTFSVLFITEWFNFFLSSKNNAHLRFFFVCVCEWYRFCFHESALLCEIQDWGAFPQKAKGFYSIFLFLEKHEHAFMDSKIV